MNRQEVFEQLKDYGCIAVYDTGSTCIPYIKNNRDNEFVAVFETYKQAKNAPYIYNVFPYYKGKIIYRFGIWGYEFHYMNNQIPVGEKYTFQEPKIEMLSEWADRLLECEYLPKKGKKIWYHVAMIKAIEKYGYDDIPDSIVKEINDIHDFKITYDEFSLYKNLHNKKGS